MPEPRRAAEASAPDQSLPLTSGAPGSAATRRGGRRQPGQPLGTWHDGQRTAESSSTGLRSSRGLMAAHSKFTDAQTVVPLRILWAPKHTCRALAGSSCQIPSSPASPIPASLGRTFPKPSEKLHTGPKGNSQGHGARERSCGWLHPITKEGRAEPQALACTITLLASRSCWKCTSQGGTAGSKAGPVLAHRSQGNTNGQPSLCSPSSSVISPLFAG